jgi:hypothetical protein
MEGSHHRRSRHLRFGYYDKLQFDPDRPLCARHGRSISSTARPRPDDVIRIGMVDLRDNDRWIELGETPAWNWQQGCMLQWLPGSRPRGRLERPRGWPLRLPHPRREADEARTLPAPIYAVSPDGKWAVTHDFRRLNDTRPGYGYAGIPDPNAGQLAPDDAGIWRMDLRPASSRC